MFDSGFEFLVIRELIFSFLVGISLQPNAVSDHIVGSYLIYKWYKLKIFWWDRHFLWKPLNIKAGKKYVGPNTELANPNSIPIEASTCLNVYLVQIFSCGFTDIHGDKMQEIQKMCRTYLKSVNHKVPQKILTYLII